MAVFVKCKDVQNTENKAEGNTGIHDMNEKLDQKQSGKKGNI